MVTIKYTDCIFLNYCIRNYRRIPFSRMPMCRLRNLKVNEKNDVDKLIHVRECFSTYNHVQYVCTFKKEILSYMFMV